MVQAGSVWTVKVGNRDPRDPLEGRRSRAQRSDGGKDGRYFAITNRINETPSDC